MFAIIMIMIIIKSLFMSISSVLHVSLPCVYVYKYVSYILVSSSYVFVFVVCSSCVVYNLLCFACSRCFLLLVSDCSKDMVISRVPHSHIILHLKRTPLFQNTLSHIAHMSHYVCVNYRGSTAHYKSTNMNAPL